jgi:hypothetical protein
MKIASIATLVLLLLTTSVIAQETSSDPPDVIVLEKSWHKEPQVSPGPSSNPLGPNEALIKQTQMEKAAIKQREEDSLANQSTTPRMPVPAPRPIEPARSVTTTYVYKIKVKNNGSKTIKSVEWEYQFLNPQSLEVMGYRRITSDTTLSPGKTKKLAGRFTRQPAILVNASQLDKKYRDQFTERLIIHRIQYSDGSVWQRPQTN